MADDKKDKKELTPEEKEKFIELGQLVTEWTVKDYYNPRIKAEVIMDMLLSADIPELLGLICKSKVTLLAKEFPISNFQMFGKDEELLTHRSSNAVDYLACADIDKKGKGKLFFVELKTTAGSVDEVQLENYLRFCGRKVADKPYAYTSDYFYGKKDEKVSGTTPLEYRKIFPFYKETCRDINEGTRKNAEAKGEAGRLQRNKKYIFQLERMYAGLFGSTDKLKVRDAVDDMAGKLDECTVCLVYVSTMDISPLIKEELENIGKKFSRDEDKNNYQASIKNPIYNIVLKGGGAVQVITLEGGEITDARDGKNIPGLNKGVQAIIEEINNYSGQEDNK